MKKTAPQSPEEITRLLRRWRRGDDGAFEALLPIVYEELRRIASSLMRSERAGHTLQTTAVVHEAYLRMADLERIDWRDRAYFFGAAARIMRRVLIDHARQHGAKKRGGGVAKQPLDGPIVVDLGDVEGLLALDRALTELEGLDQRQCRIVEMRHFAGMTVKETAEVLDVSPATVKRDWRFARTWLHRRLAGAGEQPGAAP